MLKQLIWLLATTGTIATSVLINSSPATALLYQIDDGQSEGAVGLNNCEVEDGYLWGDLMWLNAFSALPGGEIINAIQVSWAIPSESRCPDRPVLGYDDPQFSTPTTRVLVYGDRDQDGLPDDLLFESAPISVSVDPLNPNLFREISINPTQVSGTFFIAALFPHQRQGIYPAPLDIPSLGTAPRGRSLLAYDLVEPTDPEESGRFDTRNLANNTIAPQPIENFGFTGTWLLRAQGRPLSVKVPEPTGTLPLVLIGMWGVSRGVRQKLARKSSRTEGL